MNRQRILTFTLILGLVILIPVAYSATSQVFQAGGGYEITTDSTSDLDITTKGTDGGGISIRTRQSAIPTIYIDTAGEMGIGITSPTSKLHIKSASNSWNQGLRIEDDISSNYYDIIFDDRFRIGYNSVTMMTIESNGDVNFQGILTGGTWQGNAVTDAYVSDTITVGASGSVNDLALSANVSTLGTAIEKGEIANSGTLSFDWADSEVADSITAGDLVCTNCIGATEITDSYVLNTGDAISGDLRVYRSAATSTGYIYWAQNTDVWFGYDGGNFVMQGTPDPGLSVEGDLTVVGASTNFRNAILAVDGPGSGLNADLLDGISSASFSQLGTAIEKGELANSGTLSFDWADSEVADTLTIGASGVVSDSALSANVSLLGNSISGSEIVDNTIEEVDLEATNAPTNNYILSYDSTSGGFTWVVDANSGGDITDVVAGNGLTGGGSSGSVTLNVGAGTGISVAADTISATLGTAIEKGEIANSGTLSFDWADSEVADSITAGDLVCTDCIGTTEIADSYVLNTGDTMTGQLIVSVAGTDIVADKIDAGTVDPVYTIYGKRYATFMAGMTGVKEETTGVIRTKKGKYVMDLDDAEEGGDLWLFAQSINVNGRSFIAEDGRVYRTTVRELFDNMVVLLTPGFEGRVWYEKDPKTRQITVFSDKDGEVSYRLTAPRFDWKGWSNYALDGNHEGFNLDKLLL